MGFSCSPWRAQLNLVEASVREPPLSPCRRAMSGTPQYIWIDGDFDLV